MCRNSLLQRISKKYYTNDRVIYKYKMCVIIKKKIEFFYYNTYGYYNYYIQKLYKKKCQVQCYNVEYTI